MDDLEGHVLLEAELKCRFGHLDSPPLRHIGVVLVVAVDREDEVAFALELVEILQPDESVAEIAGHDLVLINRRVTLESTRLTSHHKRPHIYTAHRLKKKKRY